MLVATTHHHLLTMPQVVLNSGSATKEQRLRSVAKLFDARIANRLADLLADELVPADVVEAPPIGFEVWVQDAHFDRATAIVNATSVTDAELTYLATGVLGDESGSNTRG
jgi:hypothetical protein